METVDRVGYCGLCCPLCDHRARIPERAGALIEALRKADFEEYGHQLPGFKEFWSFLQGLAAPDPGKRCRSGNCGHPACGIRKCALEHGIALCPECDDYPCRRIETLGRSETTLILDGLRVREIGLEAWLAEQEQRRKEGFCYADARCGQCMVPTD